ncbi:MAG: hypothetical protein UX12_C0008G0006 [Candidatus Collierbacteria bacterium GW2011_GWC1_45_47]|uniref:Pseudouridine synthase n=4 Tax=Candidatus Collieribacteriota TaxID=1752725 RepID=A0A0G1KGJ4_9BACT|nr:MAG: Pseudouridine synthase [Candidatus Collierbacteria bacterium GW2011_GWF1_44_12]KKT46999.1 MAG: Pseudouridine synthase [Candidatus Collierbacteria bacterium GW2011_GWF2_44_15]KKT67703.1 MAG: Pseudouridine synthase [Candidatus Collierbacteria bacterium GW2011_GWB1_44_35]KKT98111.1 MAG: Pseudouridine synthase [Candidatus Collierbacteria bacterium GW2011_GWC2_45_15]KKU09577.1 MAG: hypothetical protein UX12_C0008G0006 [Candidatus Collierbacteria bacterium GW2011_GWC1_45_47]
MSLNIQTLYEDENTLVINKPVGVVVNRAETARGETIQDWVEGRMAAEPERWNSEGKLFQLRSGICHRLDKETSGCLMIAKNQEALVHYLAQFKERKIKKVYTALVHGRVEPAEGEVRLPLKRSLFDREKWQVHYEGKGAVTEWKVEKRYVLADTPHYKNSLTLLKLNLKTGRTHQIRVHLSFLGWPIFADDKYLNKEIAKNDRGFLSHHFLHAGFLEFSGLDGGKITVDAPLPEDCIRLLSELVLE